MSYKPDIKWQTVQKRFRQLIIPFLAWAAVSCCVHLDPTLFLAKVVHPDSGLWFLWALFFCVPEGQDRICGLYLFLVDDGHNGRIEI